VVDAEVRARFRSGDPEAVRAVYRAHGRLVHTVAYRILRDPGLADEATQHTFVKAWRAAERLDPDREMAPWLVAIARRVAIDVYRREAARVTVPLHAVPEGEATLLCAPRSDAVFDIWAVRGAVAELPADERRIVRLQHFQGLTHAEIAERLGVALGTVKSRSFRAHRRLAAVLWHLRE
jgi:RNA polymerase sigma-70 factor (ECF subfamily)